MFKRFNINKQPCHFDATACVICGISFTACLKEDDLHTLKEGVCLYATGIPG